MENYYSVRHVTRYRYSAPVRESMMQLYMQPRSEGVQWLRSFQVNTEPRAQLFAYTDHLGNAVYHFDIPQAHSMLVIDVEATIEMGQRQPVPPSVSPEDWVALATDARRAEHFDMLQRTGFTAPTARLDAFMSELGLTAPSLSAARDPMSALRRLNTTIYDAFGYDAETTTVDSPIDHALTTRRGVCQDFAHIMLSVARSWGVPCRYVSGYLFHQRKGAERSAFDASHAWVEAFVPSLGWVGFDPTNNTLAAERHIRVAIGRDYADVPPSKGVYKGSARGELAVAVAVSATRAPDRHEDFLKIVRPMRYERAVSMPGDGAPEGLSEQQQQQQQ